MALTAADVAAAVRRHYGADRDGLGPEWAALAEFSLAPGAGGQRCDLFLIRAWRGRPLGHLRLAVEIKVSRSDLLAELADPTKRAPFAAVAHGFYLACPTGLCRRDEVPDDAGLLEVTDGGRCTETVRAPLHDAAPMPPEAMVEAFRRASRAEARVRHATVDDPAALIVDLETRLAAAERRTVTAKAMLTTERTRTRMLADLIHAGLPVDEDVPCHCGNGTIRRHGRGVLGWRHDPPVDRHQCRFPSPPPDWLETRLRLPPSEEPSGSTET